jgi:hypothetical protein
MAEMVRSVPRIDHSRTHHPLSPIADHRTSGVQDDRDFASGKEPVASRM